jgi:hypothetical protein
MTSKKCGLHVLTVLQVVLENGRTVALCVSCRDVRIAKTDRAEQGTFQELAMILRNRKPEEKKQKENKESNWQIREMIQFRWRATLALQKWVPWAHSTCPTNLNQEFC